MAVFNLLNNMEKRKKSHENRLRDLEKRLIDIDEHILNLKAAFCAPDNDQTPEPADSAERGGFTNQAHAVFVCHSTYLWPLLQPAFNAFTASPAVKCSIVIIPDNPMSETPISYEVLRGFFQKMPCVVVYGFDEMTGRWMDIRILNADYLFFQTAYAEKQLWKQEVAMHKRGFRIKTPY